MAKFLNTIVACVIMMFAMFLTSFAHAQTWTIARVPMPTGIQIDETVINKAWIPEAKNEVVVEFAKYRELAKGRRVYVYDSDLCGPKGYMVTYMVYLGSTRYISHVDMSSSLQHHVESKKGAFCKTVGNHVYVEYKEETRNMQRALVASVPAAQAQKSEETAVKITPIKLPIKHDEAVDMPGFVKPNVESIEDFKRLSKGGWFSKKPTVYLDMSQMCKFTDTSGSGFGRTFTFWLNYYMFDENKIPRVVRVNLDDRYAWLQKLAHKNPRDRPLSCVVKDGQLMVEHLATTGK